MRTRLVAIAILVSSPAYADDAIYQRPAPAVASFVDAPPIPATYLGPDRTTLLIATPLLYPSIAEVAEPVLRLAGVRVKPRDPSPPQRLMFQRLELLDVKTPGAQARPITGVPAGARIGDIAWSPDGAHLAFTV